MTGGVNTENMAEVKRLRVEPVSSRLYNEAINELRKEEYPMLNGTMAFYALIDILLMSLHIGAVYLDHAGTTLYAKSLIIDFSKDMMSNLLGNPHSASSSSQHSTRRVDNVRLRVLELFNADPAHFDVVFVANATAGIKLVMESFREIPSGFWYGYHEDAHTSLIGIREAAIAGHRCFQSTEVESWLDGQVHCQPGFDESTLGLFAYPAQSNMNGSRLPLDWPGRIRNSSVESRHRVYTLLDAAALVSTCLLDLSDVSQAPDFTVLSFYKIFGFPDLGALIVRKESNHVLGYRKYFGGGTVEMVTCREEQWHIKKENSLHEQLEDGTLPVHSIIALESAINVHCRLFGSLKQISLHTSFLAKQLYDGMKSLCHGNGATVCNIYQNAGTSFNDSRSQGPVVAFNLQNNQGTWVSNSEVEKLAAIKDIHLRSGGLCNPGGIASALGLSPWDMRQNFSSGQRCGNEHDVQNGKPTGVIRVSLGAMSTVLDVTAFLDFLGEFFVDKTPLDQEVVPHVLPFNSLCIETLMVFPIKSCAGWTVPHDMGWDIKPEGLAWDREWCLVHQGSRAALSQKRYPTMALLRPSLDFGNGVLRVQYHGAISPSTPSEITIPLSLDPTLFHNFIDRNKYPTSRVCGDIVSAQIYASVTITNFFTQVLGVPCYLARFPPSGLGLSTRHAKAHLQHHEILAPKSQIMPGSFPNSLSPLRHPILLSNESPILLISRSSLNRLNEQIKSKPLSGKAASAEVFRANIIIAEDPASPPGVEQPYIEDLWRYMTTQSRDSPSSGGEEVSGAGTVFEVLGACRRCQMVCVDQQTGERNEEPFVMLAKTRRIDGRVVFGVHMGLKGKRGRVKVGDRVLGVREWKGEDGDLEKGDEER